MMHGTARLLYSHWNDIRGGRIAPRRFEIDPGRIAAILPETFIFEQAGADYKFRLAGSKLRHQFGVELAGTDVLAHWCRDDRRTLDRALKQVARGAVLVATLSGHTADGRSAAFELLILPFFHLGDAVERYVGSLGALTAPNWLGVERLTFLRLIGSDLIWPDADAPSSIDRSHRHKHELGQIGIAGASPLPGGEAAPAGTWGIARSTRPANVSAAGQRMRPCPPTLSEANVRHARIVRSGTRQFRVYEGGRMSRAFSTNE